MSFRFRRDGDLDFSKYTFRELEEALAGINPHKYPKNYANLCAAHARLKTTLPPMPRVEPDEPITDDSRPPPKYDESGRYVPNHIDAGDRARYMLFSLLLAAYGGYGVWVDDLYIPTRRGGIHFHGAPAWMHYGAFLCACLVMLSVVVDHYDRRENEPGYRKFAELFRGIGWVLLGYRWCSISSVRFEQGDSK